MAWCRGRAYSQDLRDRVLAAVEEGLSAREVAEQFQVSPSYVIKAWQRFTRTGERSARAQRSHTSRKLSEQQHEAVRAQVAAKPDATMAELCAWVMQEQGVAISLASMWATLSRLGLTLKKSPARRRTGTSRRGGSPRRLGQAAAAA
jgi:transposase